MKKEEVKLIAERMRKINEKLKEKLVIALSSR